MFKLASYSDLNAKIRGLLGKMLTELDYDKLMTHKDVTSVVLYLKYNTHYYDALLELNENDIHRGHVEVLLYRAEISDALKIARYLKGNDRRIFRYVYRKQEIEDLKKMLRALIRGVSLDEIDRKRLFVSRYSRIDFNQALLAESVEALVETLKGTRFYEVLKPLVQIDGSMDLFSAEMALDMYYYRTIKRQIMTLTKGKDQAILKRFFGAEADVKNIMWIYRSKRYYHMQREHIYPYLIPFYDQLNPSMLEDMVDAKDADAVLKLIAKGPYKEVLHVDAFDWEQAYTEFFLNRQLRILRLNPGTIAPVIGYVYAKETEIKNITTIIEGVRYGVHPMKIKDSLIIIKE